MKEVRNERLKTALLAHVAGWLTIVAPYAPALLLSLLLALAMV